VQQRKELPRPTEAASILHSKGGVKRQKRMSQARCKRLQLCANCAAFRYRCSPRPSPSPAALSALPAATPIELGQIPFRHQCFLPLSRVHSRRGILGRRTRQCCLRRVSEDPRPRRHRLELLDGSVGAFGSGSYPCLCSREPRRERMPMPSASGRSPPRKTSSRSGKTPIPISPSEGSQGRVCEVTVKSSSFLDLRLKQRFC
jgi:hypothetical protein